MALSATAGWQKNREGEYWVFSTKKHLIQIWLCGNGKCPWSRESCEGAWWNSSLGETGLSVSPKYWLFSFRISKLLIIAFPLQVQLIIWRSLNSSPVLTQFDCSGTRGYESSQGKSPTRERDREEGMEKSRLGRFGEKKVSKTGRKKQGWVERAKEKEGKDKVKWGQSFKIWEETTARQG